MHSKTLFDHVEIFRKKKVFGKCKSQIFFIGDKNAGRGIKVAEARRYKVRMILVG